MVIDRLPGPFVEVLVVIEIFPGLLEVIQFNEGFIFLSNHPIKS